MISIIVCHHKGRLIDKALESLQKSKEVEFEVIVATSDFEENVKILQSKFPEVQFISIKGGPANKRNIATRFSHGEYFAFFDDDIEATSYALFYMFQELKKDKIGCVFGKLLNMEFRNRYDEAGSFLTQTGFLWARSQSGCKDTGQFEELCPVLSGKSAAMMIHRKVFWQIGGFDASYEILGEETDLSWRVWLAGYKVLYVPKSVTYHAFNTRFKSNDFYIPRRVYFNGCRNYISMLITNLEAKNLVIPLLIQFCVWFTASMGMILTRKFEAGINILQGLQYIFIHLKSILAKRFKVQSTRRISDKELLPIITMNPPISYYINRFFHYIKTGRHG